MSYKNGVMAFLGGAVVGAIVGVLFAPEKGEVTRRKIGKAVVEGKDKLVDAIEDGRDMMMDVYHKGRERLADAIHEEREMIGREIGRDMDTVCKVAKDIKKHV